MKLFKVLLGSACAGPVGPGALMTVGLDETWWPVKTCVQDKACFNWRIGAKPGWEGSDAKNLRCETNENSWFFGQCVCKENSMDANNDPWDGCELSYDESVCYFGSCEDHSSSEGETCGGYTNLNCMSGGCCECFQGALTVDGLGCINLVPTVCPFDEIVNNGVCVPDCRDGWSYDRGDEVCEPVCRDGEYFDEAVYDRGCVPTCEEGQELSFKFEKPECMTSCKPNQAHEPHVTGEHSRRRKRHTMPGPADTRVCVTKCPEDYFYCPESGEESGYCALTAQCENRLCPDLFKYNPISAKCEFQCELDEENVFPNFEVEYDSSFGYCIPKCPPKEEYNPEFNADGCTPICDRNDNFLSINEETGEAYCEWCEDEHVYDPIAEECVYDCPEGTDYYEYIPACLPHCEKNNETSIYYNIELERCTEKCSFGKVLRSEEIDGNFIDKCYDECTLMTEWNPETKMCIDMCTIPYEWNADKLKCEIACPNGLYKDEEGNDTPSEFSEGQGACIPICDDGFMFDRYVDPYHCIEECNWRNETFDEEIMGCRERCKKNFDYNYESSMCELECKEGWEATMVPGTNDDNDDEGRMTMDEMRCSPICKIYEKLNKIKNECENICPEWLNYNSESGNCTLTCPDNYYFSPPDECVPQCKKDDSCTPEICRTKVDVEAVCDVSSEKISFEDAEKACSAKGGSLWVPKSSADLDYIIDLGKELWLGIEFNGDDWVYSKDGSKIKNTLTAWKYGDAPIPSKDGYGCVKHEKKGTWKEDDCGHDHNYMCAVEGVNCFNVDADGMVEVNCDGTRPTEPECQTETEADAVCEKSKHAKKHSDAKKACNEKGGHLWSPKHDHDHDYLSQMVEDADIWVGIEHDGDNWVFTDDGSIVEDFSNWKDGSKPSYKEGKHCAKKEKKSGNYKEYDCEKEKHYVCKFDRYDCINDLPVVTDDGTIHNDCSDGCEQPVTVEDPCAVNDEMTPADAAAFCAAGNGKLWAPRTQADLDYINGLGDVETWLGIKWNGIKWAYTDSNEEVSATMHNWKDGASPADAYGKECVKREKKGTWKEDDCSHEHSFICQYDGVDCLSRIDGPADTCNGEVVEPLDCPDGSLYSPELADCVPDCGENFEFSIKHLKCITRCPEGEIFGANVDKCREQCVEGDFYDKDLDACVTDCPKGSDYSDSQQCDDVDECTVDENVKVSADGICTPGYSSASFDLADRFCKGKGGSLLTPTSQADFDYIQSLGDEEFWLGIVTNEDGDLVYVETGEAINDVLTNWAESSKSSKDHDHSCVKREKKGTWKLDDCLHTHNYICKVEEIDCDNLPDVVDGYFVVNQVRPSDICGKDNECTNTDGGYDCACSDGFAWSDKREWCVPEWCSVLDEAGIENNWSIKQQNCTARCQGGEEISYDPLECVRPDSCLNNECPEDTTCEGIKENGGQGGNDGTRMVEHNGYRCRCALQSQFDEIDAFYDFEMEECDVRCPEGWTFDEAGPDCIPPGPCTVEPCPMEAECIENGDEYQCVCPEGEHFMEQVFGKPFGHCVGDDAHCCANEEYNWDEGQCVPGDGQPTTPVVTTTTTTTTTKFDADSECGEGYNTKTDWHWLGGKQTIQQQLSDNAFYAKHAMFNNNPNFPIRDENGLGIDYLGFLIYDRKNCGPDFIDAWADGRLDITFLDGSSIYKKQFQFNWEQPANKQQWSTTIQFSAKFNEGDSDVGNTKKDIIYTVVTGLDSVDFGTKNKLTCLTKVQVGFLKNDGSMDLEKDYSKCAGANKSVGWRKL